MIQAGKKAKAFSLKDQHGTKHALKDYAGEWILLYFYPKDMTPGCTKQACGVQETFSKFKSRKIKVFGVSIDSVESHAKFAEKYNLKFPLLSDEKMSVITKYGAFAEKENKKTGEMENKSVRCSFIIAPDGKVVKVYEKVKAATHAETVLEDMIEIKKEWKKAQR